MNGTDEIEVGMRVWVVRKTLAALGKRPLRIGKTVAEDIKKSAMRNGRDDGGRKLQRASQASFLSFLDRIKGR